MGGLKDKMATMINLKMRVHFTSFRVEMPLWFRLLCILICFLATPVTPLHPHNNIFCDTRILDQHYNLHLVPFLFLSAQL